MLICEDSQTYAAGLSRLLARDPEIDVVGVCASAEETLARLQRPGAKPHLVTMDLELPGMSGGDAIEQIMSVQPVPILVLAGGVHARLGSGRSPRSAPARSRCSPRTRSTCAIPAATTRGRSASA